MTDDRLEVNKVAAEIVVTAVAAIFSSVFSKLEDFKNQHDFFNQAAKNYIKNLETQINFINVLGMGKPVTLKNLYVKVHILDKLTTKTHSTIEELEEGLGRDQKHFGKIRKTEYGLNAIKNNKSTIVLGKPGSGKTTFLKHIALESFNDKDIERIPVFVQLRDISNDITLKNFVTEQFNICNFSKPKEYIETLLNEGKLIVLFDGLDEVDESQDVLIRQMNDFVNKYSSCKYVISCRTASYNYIFTQFTDIEIADFEDEQIKAFSTKWFDSKKPKLKAFLEDLSHVDNRSIYELAKSPLLLTLLCINYDDGMEFPLSKAALYSEAIDALLKKWDTSRQIKRSNIYKELNIQKKRKLLQKIGKASFEERKYFFPKGYAIKKIEEILEQFGTGLSDVDFDGDAVLCAIESQHGILVQRAKNIYSFAHLTFQEYFTAAAICENTNFNDRFTIIEKHLLDDRWREVFLLTTSKLDNADKFLIEIRRKISSLPNGVKLTRLLSDVSNLVNPQFDCPLLIKRSMALKIILESCLSSGKSTISHADILWSFNASETLFKRVIDVYPSVITMEDETDLEIRIMDLGISKNRQKVDDLVAQIQLMDPSIFENFSHYLKASKLLIDCLSVEAMISKSVKKSLVENFLIERTDIPIN